MNVLFLELSKVINTNIDNIFTNSTINGKLYNFNEEFISNINKLITEFDFRSELMFGFCEIVKGCGELGYVSLKEIEELNEIYFIWVKKINKKLNEAKKELGY